MNIIVIGAGYVGLVVSTSLAYAGHTVFCVENDDGKRARLSRGESYLFENGLQEILKQCIENGKLTFYPSVYDVADNSDTVFLCLPTPKTKVGVADISSLLQVADELGKCICNGTTVIIKSTVPIGTTARLEKIIEKSMKAEGRKLEFDMVMNPEFLRQGCAMEDFAYPHAIIVGAKNPKMVDKLKEIFEPAVKESKYIYMRPVDAEITKYASNLLLAARISMINELANLCEAVGANVQNVKLGIGSDPNIGMNFLNAGIGYGGSCFPKDIEALIKTANIYGIDAPIMRAVQALNERQKHVIIAKIIKRFGSKLDGMRFGVWGLSFKPGTDDMREAPSIDIITGLHMLGAEVYAYDPRATENARTVLGDACSVYADDKYKVLQGIQALLVLTEWDEFYRPDIQRLKETMEHPLIFDGRNIYSWYDMEKCGIELIQIGIGYD